MDFKTQAAAGQPGATGLVAVATEALLIVLASAEAVSALEQPLAQELQRAIKDGDYEC